MLEFDIPNGQITLNPFYSMTNYNVLMAGNGECDKLLDRMILESILASRSKGWQVIVISGRDDVLKNTGIEDIPLKRLSKHGISSLHAKDEPASSVVSGDWQYDIRTKNSSKDWLGRSFTTAISSVKNLPIDRPPMLVVLDRCDTWHNLRGKGPEFNSRDGGLKDTLFMALKLAKNRGVSLMVSLEDYEGVDEGTFLHVAQMSPHHIYANQTDRYKDFLLRWNLSRNIYPVERSGDNLIVKLHMSNLLLESFARPVFKFEVPEECCDS
ncbi:MAG: hypothetical protein RJQ08_01095 [Salinisphaeraceae bacterium]